ncbi:MAG: hypothetical protein RR872_07110 [Mucinivorans sp.]
MKSCTSLMFIVLVGLLCSTSSMVAHAKRPLTKPNQMAISGSNTARQVCRDLQKEQLELGNQISALSISLHTASKSSARKITNQINLITDKLAIIERKLAAFPVSVTDSTIVKPKVKDDASFRRSLDSIASLRVAESNPFVGHLSNDPELDRMYRDYLSVNGNNVPMVNLDQTGDYEQNDDQAANIKGRVYRVMVAISGSKLSRSALSSLTEVIEQRMPSGGYIYYQGNYATRAAADAACNKILSARHFRDAFVVAMVGNRRVPL